MRAVPFYCPYCAEQTIEPIGDNALLLLVVRPPLHGHASGA